MSWLWPPTLAAPPGGKVSAVAADYHFVTRWRVPGTRQEVTEVLRDPAALPRWWPSVYLGVDVIEPGGPDGVGRIVDLYTKGWLPYTLRWRFTITRSSGLNGFTIAAMGDFVGTGTWVFKQDGDHVVVLYDWRIRAEKPLLKRLTLVMRPFFSANHRWAMRQGEASLRRELEARRLGPDAAAALPPPPQATFTRLLRGRRSEPATP